MPPPTSASAFDAADFADNAATLNRVFRGSLVAFAALAALVVSPLAAATSVERVRVAGPGVTAAFPRGISLELTSPPEYRRGSVSADRTSGRWLGPEYWASGDTSKRGTTSIRWSVDFQGRARAGTGGRARRTAARLAAGQEGSDRRSAPGRQADRRDDPRLLRDHAGSRAERRVLRGRARVPGRAEGVHGRALRALRSRHPTRPASGATTSSAGSTSPRSGRAARPSGRCRAYGCSATSRRRASPSPTRAAR